MRRLFLVLALAACAKAAPPTETRLGPNPPAKVGRIVTLAPSLTDLVLALGAGDRLVGVTRYDDAPEVAALPRVGGYSDPSAETILRLRPDLVLCQPSPGNKGAVEVVAGAGIAVRVFPLEALADVTTTTRRLGELLDRREAAEALIARIEAARTKARAAAAKRGRRIRTLILFDVEPLIAGGPASFAGELLGDAGAENIVERSPQAYPQLPMETVLSRRPEVILLAPLAMHGGSLENLPPALRPAARVLHSFGILRPGPHVVDALEELTALFDRLGAAP